MIEFVVIGLTAALIASATIVVVYVLPVIIVIAIIGSILGDR